MDDVGDKRIVKTSFGEALVVKRLEQLDEQPEVLECGLVVLLEDELPRIAGETAEERVAGWRRRERDLAEFRRLKAADPSMTVDTPWAQP